MKRNGSQIIIDALKKQGVKEVFGYPGGCVIPLFDEFLNHSDISIIRVAHEQAAAHAADGYARVAGKPGVVIVTSGPGATNTITGIATAAMDSIPMIIISGQVRTTVIGTNAFQETNVIGVSRPVTKHNYLVKDLDQLPKIMEEAFYIASTGRPGPVLIDLPVDLQTVLSEAPTPEQIEISGYELPPKPDTQKIKKAWEMIRQSTRPVIYAGGGVNIGGAGEELRKFAQATDIPVTTTLLGQGVIPEDHELSLGMLGMHGTFLSNWAMNRADLVITLGARFDDRVTGNVEKFLPMARIIHVDIDPSVINKIKKANMGVVAEVKDFLEEINRHAQKLDTDSWLSEIQLIAQEHPLPDYDQVDMEEGNLRPEYVIKEFSRQSKGDALVVSDVGQHQMFTALHFNFIHQRSHITSGGLGTMGFSLPAAVGACFVPDHPQVISFCGDGGFQMNIQELATVRSYNLPIIIAVMNNRNLGMVKQWQDLFWDSRYAATLTPDTPDFVKIAEGYFIEAKRITKKEEVAPAIAEALKKKGPILLEFMLDRHAMVYPMIPAGGEFKDIIEGE